MTSVTRDQNSVPALVAVLNTDGRTIVPIKANPTNHGISISDGTTGSGDFGPTNAVRDDNQVPVFMATSSADGKTPVAIYADSTGKLLIKST